MKPHLADGSVGGQQMQAAGVRAVDAHRLVRQRATRLADDLDEVTATEFQLRLPHDDDSLVAVVGEAISTLKPSDS